MNHYHINLFYSNEDGGWMADIPDLEFCSAFGESSEEALTQVLIVKEAWLETARLTDLPIPEATYRPVTAG